MRPHISTPKGPIRTACLLRAIAKRVRYVGARESNHRSTTCAAKADDLAQQLEALALSVDLAEQEPHAGQHAELAQDRARQLMRA